MTPPVLRISPELSLPVEAVTETFGILAKRGAGKSNAAVVMAEEMSKAGLPWVAIDPKGDWFGVRSSADGKSPGLALPVFGGLHGDVPLEPTAGPLVADLVADQRLTCVLDVSEFSKGDQRRFLLGFAQRLIRRNTEPLHLFLEEAHEYLPQRVMGNEAELVGAWSKIVKQGRFRGIGATLVSQRSASLNKDVLTQVDTLIVLRTTAPQDRKAILAWVEEHDFGRELVASLPSLEDGEAWVWSPEFLKATERIRFRRRSTYDSGATPVVGRASRAPATLADVDLAAIKEQMAETIERAKADDPRELRRRISVLERQLQDAQRPTPEPEVQVEVVEVPVFDERLWSVVMPGVQAVSGILEDLRAELQTAIRRAGDDRTDIPRARPAGRNDDPVGQHRRREPKGTDLPRRQDAGDQHPGRAQRADPPPVREPRREAVPGAEEGAQLGKAERLILTALAQHGARTKTQLALLTGYSAKGGGFGNAIGSLRTKGYIDGRERLEATPEGKDALGTWDPLPSGPELVNVWLAHPKLGKAERLILGTLVDHWPDAMSKDELADATGYAASGGGFGNALGRLRTLELIEGRGELRAADDLCGAG